MKTVVKQISVTTEKGNVLDIVITVKRGYEKAKKEIWVDEPSTIEKMEAIEETIVETRVNGNTFIGGVFPFVPEEYKKAGYYGTLASKILITKNVYHQIEKAIYEAETEAETDEDYKKYVEIMNKAAKNEEEYQQHVKNIENMMTLNGRTY